MAQQASRRGLDKRRARAVVGENPPAVERGGDSAGEDAVRRDEVRAPKGATREVLEPMILELESVKRALDGKPVSKFIVVPDRIVNIVCAN